MDEVRELEFEIARVALGVLNRAEAEVLEVLGPDALAEPQGDGSLGFGMEAATWTGVAVTVAQGVTAFLGGVAHGYASDVGKARLQRLLRRIRNQPDAEVLSAEELDAIRVAAEAQAQQAGIEVATARLLADAIVGSLGRRPQPPAPWPAPNV